ncbi:MAG: hypothetical protein ACO329_09930 [Steroidobacteraceae bacterium]
MGKWRSITCVSLLLLAGCGSTAMPLPSDQLLIRINLLCTTCDDFIRCRGPSDTDDSYTLYRLREQSFWAQVATIWDYLIQRIRPKTAHTRPIIVYARSGGLRRVVSEEGSARVDAALGQITLPDSRIDMRDGRWFTKDDGLQGRCEPLNRREGYAWVRELLGRPLPAVR